MSAKVPRLSVGLAVYNGEKFLREAIESILAQTFTDFELILSDNASTDGTAAICAEYAARDPRVRYFRNPVNIGGVNNENHTFELARGDLFRLAAHDDVCAPTLFEKCVAALDAYPEAVLCHTALMGIDEEGRQLSVRCGREGCAETPSARFRELSWRWYPCEATYGVIRSSVLRKTRLQQNYTGSDRVLLCELALHGPFIQLEEPLFLKRYHEGNRYKDWRGRMAWFFPDLSKTGKITFPYWLQFFDYFTTLRRVPLPPLQRAFCGVWIGRWTLLHGKSLLWDLVQAAIMAAQPKRRRRERYADVARWS